MSYACPRLSGIGCNLVIPALVRLRRMNPESFLRKDSRQVGVTENLYHPSLLSFRTWCGIQYFVRFWIPVFTGMTKCSTFVMQESIAGRGMLE